MKKNFYTINHQSLINEYILNDMNRLSIVANLTPVIQEIIQRAASKLEYHLSDDDEQDVYIHIITRVLPKINQDKAKAALAYIYLASRNYLLSEVIKYKRKKVYMDDIDMYINNEKESMMMMYEQIDEAQEARDEIVKQLDIKISEQSGNRVHTVFLLLIKHYLIENNFCEIGLQDYICTVMRIKISTFRSLCSRVGIKAKIFDNK